LIQFNVEMHVFSCKYNTVIHHTLSPLSRAIKKNITELSCLAVALLILLGTMSLFYKVSLQYVCV